MGIDGLYVIENLVFSDARGCFFESYHKSKYLEQGVDCDFVQDNVSVSSYGVVRGLHLQTGDFAQAKLVQVLKGRVLDVAVDLRPGSETFGQHFAIELSDENRLQFFIPRGFAHGFSVLSQEAIFHYKCDNFYNKASESGIIYNDKDLAIDWKVPEAKIVVSEKDLELPSFRSFK
ncbi:MAG TPA: dTDP-4-dehydrorhamnose 3,5-epimerase [Marinilabiliaceae bacterium]|nr:dTDP-4-dehydrorhamnose 3,5-epimerase [Marinilabiliaceae bacterium]